MVSSFGSIRPNELDTKDLSSLNIENVQGMKITNKEKLMKTAREFESVFVAQLLNETQATVQKSGFMSGGPVEQKFRSMMNQYIAKDIANSPTANFGIAKQIYEQMKTMV